MVREESQAQERSRQKLEAVVELQWTTEEEFCESGSPGDFCRGLARGLRFNFVESIGWACDTAKNSG